MLPLTGCEPAASEAHVIRSLPILVLMVHSRCNCRCVMCDIWKTSESRELTLTDLQPHLDSFRDLGVRWIVFSGGEPLMNRGLFPLAKALRAMDIRLTILSTGLLLAKYAVEVASTFDEVIVSLDGPQEVHDDIRRVPRAFEAMADGIGRLYAIAPGLPIRARTTVQRANHRHLRETIAGAKSLQLASISFLAADVTSTAFNRELVWPVERQNQVALTIDEVRILEAELQRIIEDYRDEISSGFIAESPSKLLRIASHFRAQLGLERPVAPPCNAPWVSAVVEADGSVRPCFFHRSIGNIHDQNLLEVLNSSNALDFRQNLDMQSDPKCQRCVCSLNYNQDG